MVAAVRSSLSRLEADPATDARAALALYLAKQLDAEGEANVANLSRELRITMTELEAKTDRGDDDLAEFLASLSPDVVDAQD